MSIEPGKLGEPIQEKELLFGFWVTNEDEVLKDLPEAGEYAPFIGVGYLGLFGLRLIRGPWSVQGCLFKTEDQGGEVSGGCVSGHEGGVCWVPSIRFILQSESTPG